MNVERNMAKKIDTCGLTCPAPVLLVKNVIEHSVENELTVLVDNEASRENVTRFLTSKKYHVTNESEGTNYKLTARLGDPEQPLIETERNIEKGRGENQKILVLLTTNRFGSGDDDLGEKLMINYLKTLKEMGQDLWQLVLVNGGVKLSIDSSPVLEELQGYEKSGVIVLVCGTCLEHFGLTAKKMVGGVTNMLDIVTSTQLADKVVTIG